MRLACRVCLAVGVDDPIAWLENIEPQTLAIWRAFYRVEPWGSEMERSAEQSSITSMLLSMMAAGNGVEVAPREVKDFMPGDWVSAYEPLTKRRESKKINQVEGSRMLCASVFPSLRKPDDWDEELQAKIAAEKARKANAYSPPAPVSRPPITEKAPG